MSQRPQRSGSGCSSAHSWRHGHRHPSPAAGLQDDIAGALRPISCLAAGLVRPRSLGRSTMPCSLSAYRIPRSSAKSPKRLRSARLAPVDGVTLLSVYGAPPPVVTRIDDQRPAATPLRSTKKWAAKSGRSFSTSRLKTHHVPPPSFPSLRARWPGPQECLLQREHPAPAEEHEPPPYPFHAYAAAPW